MATASASHTLCSEVFVSRQDPQLAYDEYVTAEPAYGAVEWSMTHEVDLARREVKVRSLGGFETRAVFRDGLGCLNILDDAPADAPAPSELELDENVVSLLPELAGPEAVETSNPRLKAALDAAFSEPKGQPFRHTKAIVIVQDGQVIAERYAPGYDPQTPVNGWSATKAVTNALVGLLVQKGQLAVDRPAPIAAWRAPDDPRHAIQVDQLLRMTSGLTLGTSLSFGLSTGWDTAARALYLEPDMASFSEGAPLDHAPGSYWNYANGNYHILGRIIRDAVGGHAQDVLRFARRELFLPLGMRQVTLELDSTGSPIGGMFLFAPAREWARLGILFLNGGAIGERSILSQDWIRYSTTATPNGWGGHAAGWWTNQGNSDLARIRVSLGVPPDAFMAVGSLGQFLVVVPSERLVIAHFAAARYHDPEQAMTELASLVSNTIAALH